ncbi:MAG: nuclear transport factor 2 family protein, partial [Alphaproteobacteria bacterium]
MTDASRIEALEARLRLLEDKEAIRALRDAYHGCINDGRFHEIADLFTDDGYVRLGYLAQYRGRAEIDAGFRSMGTRERFYIMQYIHRHRISGAGDEGPPTTKRDARPARGGL